MKQILLLHGAIGSKSQFAPLSSVLESQYTVLSLDFSEHGHSDKHAELFSIEAFANDVIDFLNSNNVYNIDLFGYSMGGYVAIFLAKHYPERVNRVFTLATKFKWTPELAIREAKMLNPEKILDKFPSFAHELKCRHEKSNWKQILKKTAAMMIVLGDLNPLSSSALSTIQHSVLVAVGDRDSMVSIEETIGAFRCLPNARLAVFPNTIHPIEKVSIEPLALAISAFFN